MIFKKNKLVGINLYQISVSFMKLFFNYINSDQNISTTTTAVCVSVGGRTEDIRSLTSTGSISMFNWSVIGKDTKNGEEYNPGGKVQHQVMQ